MAQASERSIRSKSNGATRGALKSRAGDVIDDFAELRKDVGRLYEAASHAARSEMRVANNRVGRLAADLRDRASAGAEYMKEQVRSHPYAVVGASLGAGLLIGLLAKRR
ncbi:MAG: DUF883 family protein [Proteobacteria bacterium]|nr:DUF883 family protein [Pseudomonadota bacterium]